MDVIVAGGGPAGLMTAALLDVAGVRVDVYERGSEPTRQFRGTALHPRTLEVLTMFDAGDDRRISDVLLAQGRRTHAGDSQLAAGRARRQKAPYSRPGPSATLTGSRTGFRRARPILASPDQQHRAAGRRQPGLELSAMRTLRADSHATRSVTVTPGRELRYHRPGKRSSCPPRPTPAGPRTCSR